jgi:protein-S-isoprenylcysteine O-methyltransferase Ste14
MYTTARKYLTVMGLLAALVLVGIGILLKSVIVLAILAIVLVTLGIFEYKFRHLKQETSEHYKNYKRF